MLSDLEPARGRTEIRRCRNGQETHAKVVPLTADMTHRGEVKGLAERAIAALGKVDILINNAGGNMPQPIDQITDEVGITSSS
jgi:NAD(P)-dependent dehydrogenase (short-subunit alcohol dehydrogenase family)